MASASTPDANSSARTQCLETRALFDRAQGPDIESDHPNDDGHFGFYGDETPTNLIAPAQCPPLVLYKQPQELPNVPQREREQFPLPSSFIMKASCIVFIALGALASGSALRKLVSTENSCSSPSLLNFALSPSYRRELHLQPCRSLLQNQGGRRHSWHCGYRVYHWFQHTREYVVSK